ncbi:GtrA family protein [uncultured Tateyamaria sp.]|uniref:GtrA family protein n=1 Tax=uncultured Tateyamaria sp. TaxID=455651 RepID=UPI00260D8385|nr:GtrA family protein [uncultured Tateyamaria sp.]
MKQMRYPIDLPFDPGTDAARAAPQFRARVLRFLGAGVLNTGFGYGVYAATIWMGAAPQIALIAQFGLGVLWNYTTHARLVFGVQGTARLPRYILIYVALYALNAALLTVLLAGGLNPYLAQALALPLIVVASYIGVSAALGVPLRGGLSDD